MSIDTEYKVETNVFKVVTGIRKGGQKVARIFASKLRGMSVLTDKGLRVGQIYDMMVDESNGKITAMTVKPESKETAASLPTDESGNILVPFAAVQAIRDYIVVSERNLAVQQLKKQR